MGKNLCKFWRVLKIKYHPYIFVQNTSRTSPRFHQKSPNKKFSGPKVVSLAHEAAFLTKTLPEKKQPEAGPVAPRAAEPPPTTILYMNAECISKSSSKKRSNTTFATYYANGLLCVGHKKFKDIISRLCSPKKCRFLYVKNRLQPAMFSNQW